MHYTNVRNFIDLLDFKKLYKVIFLGTQGVHLYSGH